MTPSKLKVSLLLCSLALLCPYFVNGKYSAVDVDQVGKICNATKEDMDLAKNYEIPSTETGKCFMKCFNEKAGKIDAFGKYSKNGTAASFEKYWAEVPLNIRSKINNKCYNEALQISTESGTCNYFYKIEICLMSEFKRYAMV